jgi:hypothetical protein
MLGLSFQGNKHMTKDEHKSAIVTQLQQQSLNLLVDSLAAALAEIESLKAAAADKPTP